VSNVLEIASYRLKDGVTDEQYTAAADSLLRWAGGQPGFISRDLVRTDEKLVELVWWTDKASADAALEAAGRAPEAGPFFEAVDMDSFEYVLGEQAAEQFVASA
jgi:heme-degrading monooxygenase HmoA